MEFIKSISKDDAPECCCASMVKESEVFDPSRGRMLMYKCLKCGAHAMVFAPAKRDQSRAVCSDCESYYRKGCFSRKSGNEYACEDFEEVKG